jgi:plastocyanin
MITNRTILVFSVALSILAVEAQAEGKTYTVRIEKDRFVPAQVTAEVGDSIVWENRDSRPHRVRRSGGDTPFDSGILRPGKPFSWRVRGVSSIPYECPINPEMKGTIDVVTR